MKNPINYHKPFCKGPHFNLMIIVVHCIGSFFGINKLLAQGAFISWNPNTEADLAGYRVYYGKSSYFFRYNVDVGLQTFHLIPALPDTGVFRFTVTAYDSSGNESGFSKIVTLYLEGDAAQQEDRIFSLGSNYPNPFNPTTKIPYFLPEDLSIKLAVYDLLGRQVICLEEGKKAAGDYEALWDGKDEYGRRVANGIYFCRLWVGDFCQTKKLIMTQ
ncbi:T9SS type A sorting domain-containing protein [bacterium]|nr:T9SS type A sorting domain-containing protein [bacterium]RQV97073.1 MAG: T9SS C-terminal target domain-containing protein [bacterium]